jgi:hypothetical protein
MPCAITASAPASCAASASSNVMAVANHAMPRSCSRSTYSASNSPMIDETAVGAASSIAAHCAV